MRSNGFVSCLLARPKSQILIGFILQRVDRIKSTLSSDLDHLFSLTVQGLTGGKDGGMTVKVVDSDKARLTSDMFDCLRTYDALGLWRDAEDVLRREVVREFVKKVISLSQ